MRQKHYLVTLSASVLAAAIATSAGIDPADAVAQQARYDVVLRGGTVLDGSGSPRFAADVGVIDGFIARVGDLTGAEAETDIDVHGLFVTPGFVNLHSHPRGSGLQLASNMLTQGVTTEILNPDGGGPLDIAGQLSDLRESGLALNIGANIGFNRIWTEVVGRDDRPATSVEIERMRDLVVEGLTMGAWGVSARLDYKPAYFATTDQVVEVVGAAGGWRTNFTNHDRLAPESNFSSRVGVAETLEIGKRAGLVENARNGAREFRAARIGYDTEGAELVATFLNGEEGGRTARKCLAALGGGQRLELVVGGKLRLDDARAAIREARDIFGQAVIGLGTEHQIDGRGAAAHLLALGLCDAAGHADNEVLTPAGFFLLQFAQTAKLRIDLLGRLFADVAGIQNDNVGLFGRIHLGIARRGHDIDHAGRIIDIHLAAIGLYEDLLARRGGRGLRGLGRRDGSGWR